MKSLQRSFQSVLALGSIISMTLNPFHAPHAYADQKSEFHTVCDPINQGGVNADGSSNGGDQAKGECAKAEMAMNAAKVEKTKMIVFGSAAAACTAMAVIENLPWSAVAAKFACGAISGGVSLSSSIMDKNAVTQNQEIVGSFTVKASQVMSYAGAAPLLLGGAMGPFASYINGQAQRAGQQVVQGAFQKGFQEGAQDGVYGGIANGAKQAGSESTKKLAEEASKKAADQAAKKVACVASAVTLGVQVGLSTAGLLSANNVFNKSLLAARSLRASANTAVTQLDLNPKSMNFGGMGNGAISANPKPSGSHRVISETCDEKGGNEYIRCMGQLSPELAAISNNPDFMGTMEKALGGKSLGDFAKSFNGSTPQEAANHIGSGLGMSGGALAKLMDQQQKLAQDTGALEKYEPLTYTRAGGGSSPISDKAPDFNSMMGDLLKQLNPEADAKKEDSSELAFRQMDLLSPDKIEQNKDISLFARVGYRYRKNLDKVEQLNWSRIENQVEAQRQPASP